MPQMVYDPGYSGGNDSRNDVWRAFADAAMNTFKTNKATQREDSLLATKYAREDARNATLDQQKMNENFANMVTAGINNGSINGSNETIPLYGHDYHLGSKPLTAEQMKYNDEKNGYISNLDLFKGFAAAARTDQLGGLFAGASYGGPGATQFQQQSINDAMNTFRKNNPQTAAGYPPSQAPVQMSPNPPAAGRVRRTAKLADGSTMIVDHDAKTNKFYDINTGKEL